MNIELGNHTILVTVVYKNNRNMYFRFNENADLIVTCPKGTLDEEIVKLIKKNESSLLKMYNTALDKKNYNEKFYLLGKEYKRVFDEKYEEVKIEGDFIYAKDEVALEKFVKDKYTEVFTKEADACAKCFKNLPEYKLKFRFMRTRWGVNNSRDNSITLNTELIKKDERLIDYVIIHEMAHFYEHNHSKDFWKIVSLACPDYKERRKELRK